MKVFVTGATGFIGSALVKELKDAGHEVMGLARSEASANSLVATGVRVHRGDLEDLNSLRSGATWAEGVIHAGFVHDFSRFKEVCEIDRVAIETIGSVLEGSNRPFIVTSGTALVKPGTLATEDMDSQHDTSKFPRVSETAALAFAARGVRAMAIRLSPSVHGVGDRHGFIPILINIAREKGISAHIGEGLNHWNAVHRLDAVRLYRLALERGQPGSRYHAVGDEAIQLTTIAAAIAKKMRLPQAPIPLADAASHFGWFTNFAAIDCPASSKLTQQRLGWKPTHPSLLDDLSGDIYFK